MLQRQLFVALFVDGLNSGFFELVHSFLSDKPKLRGIVFVFGLGLERLDVLLFAMVGLLLLFQGSMSEHDLVVKIGDYFVTTILFEFGRPLSDFCPLLNFVLDQAAIGLVQMV